MKKQILLLFTVLLQFTLYSQLEFNKHIVIDETYAAMNAMSVFACDIDGDGDMDILSASSKDNKIAWYKNMDGNGTFSVQKHISTEAMAARQVYAADLDGDGDMDVLSASAWDNKIAWYENMDGQGNFSNQKIISTDAHWATSVFAADLDGDGDMDVLSASAWDNKIAWYMNLNGQGDFSGQLIISVNALGARSVFATDLDGDGDMDVLSASRDDDKIAWHENIYGMGIFGPPQIISLNAEKANSVYADDIDGDGDMDVIAAAIGYNKIAWYENINDNFDEHILEDDYYGATFVFSIDMDKDGDKDILFCSELHESVGWFENNDGQGGFSSPILINSAGYQAVYACDLDGDEDIDLIAASQLEHKVVWHENTNGMGDYGEQKEISTIANTIRQICTSDLDSDGDMDVISASYKDGKIAWYENNGYGSFGYQNVVTIQANGACSVSSSDLDNDGDMDIISASYWDNTIAWYKNLNGLGDFGEKIVILDTIEMVIEVLSDDLDGDGDNDIIYISANDIYWCKNLNGNANFDTPTPLNTGYTGLLSINVIDIDKDGDLDIFSASTGTQKLAWHENVDGLGNFGEPHVIDSLDVHPRRIIASDFNGDEYIDLLAFSGSFWECTLMWYKNEAGYKFGDAQILSTDLDFISSINAVDIDVDGDMDILASTGNFSKIVWFENIDGLGGFSQAQLIVTNLEAAKNIITCDLNGDGDQDLLFSHSNNTIAWYENLHFLSVNEKSIEPNELLVYPNPAHDYVIFDTSTLLSLTNNSTQGTVLPTERSKVKFAKASTMIEIFNLFGKKVVSIPLVSEKTKWDVKALAKGVYFYQVLIEDNVVSGKIIIQ